MAPQAGGPAIEGDPTAGSEGAPAPAEAAGDGYPAPPVAAPDPSVTAKIQADVERGATASAADPVPASGPAQVVVTIFSEKIEGEGEDAEPFFVAAGDTAIVAVCDGLGGGGAQRYASPTRPGEIRKGAYLASRRVREALAVLEWRPIQPLPSAEALGAQLHAALVGLGSSWRSASRIVAHHSAKFPTTVAVAEVVYGPTSAAVDLRWCGDSRVFAIEPEHGLVQLTRDHVRGDERSADDFGLGGDAPMDRKLTADGVDLDEHEVEVDPGAMVVAATDGCFAYWPSIMHFEQALLSTLAEAVDTDGWTAALRRRILEVTGDDATLALVGPPGDDLAILQKRFATRLQFLDRLLAPGIDDDALLRHTWRHYAGPYFRLLPEMPVPAAAPASPDAHDDRQPSPPTAPSATTLIAAGDLAVGAGSAAFAVVGTAPEPGSPADAGAADEAPSTDAAVSTPVVAAVDPVEPTEGPQDPKER